MVKGSDEFKCYDDTGYNCMGRYNLHGRLTVSLLACFGELTEVSGEMNGMKLLCVGFGGCRLKKLCCSTNCYLK